MTKELPSSEQLVIDYLARKLSIAREESSKLPAAIERIIREPREGIAALFAMLDRPVPKKLDVHVSALGRLLPKSPALPSRATQDNAEQQPRSELQKVERGVERAMQMDLVREERFRSHAPSPRVGYLLSSSHYGITDFDPTNTPEDIKQSQIQLFRLCHLLAQEGVQSRIRVEGRDVRQTYTPFRGLQPQVRQGNRMVNVLSPEGQHILFENPAILREVMDSNQVLSGQTGMSTPCFYAYASGVRFDRAHSAETDRLCAFREHLAAVGRAILAEVQILF